MKKNGCILYFPAYNDVVITTMVFETFEKGLEFMENLGLIIQKRSEEDGLRKAIYDINFINKRHGGVWKINYYKDQIKKYNKMPKNENSNHYYNDERGAIRRTYKELIKESTDRLKETEEEYNQHKEDYDLSDKVRNALFTRYYNGNGGAYIAVIKEVLFGKSLFGFDLD